MTKSTVAKADPAPAKPKGVWMWSPRGNLDNHDTSVKLLSGHTMVIPHEKTGCEVPQLFRKQAIALGCIPVGMEDDEDDTHGFDRMSVIRSKIKEMLEGQDPSQFTNDGKPNLNKLAALCGFQLDRNDVNRAWDELSKEADGEEAADIIQVGSQ